MAAFWRMPARAKFLFAGTALSGLFVLGGASALLTGAASTSKTIDYTFTVTEGDSNGPRLAGAVITTAGHPSHPEDTCSPTTSSPSDGAGKVVVRCGTGQNGGEKSYIFVNATLNGYHVKGAPHPPGDVFAVCDKDGGANGASCRKDGITIVMEKDAATAVATQAVPPAPNPAPAPAAAYRQVGDDVANGTVQITTYNGKASSTTKLAGVKVGIGPGASNVVCRGVNPNTESVRYETTATDGRADMKCSEQLDGNPREYVLVYAAIEGYEISPESQYKPGDKIRVDGNATTEVHITLRSTSPLPQPLQDTNPNNGSSKTEYGITTYVGSVASKQKLGGVTITLAAGRSKVDCVTPTSRTDSSGSSYGQARFTCWTDSAGKDREYVIAAVQLPGYHVSTKSEHKVGDTIRVGGAYKDISIVMQKDGVSDAQTGAPSPANTGVQTPQNTTPRPENQKTGSVQVTAFGVDPATGNRSRLSGVNIHVQSVGYETQDGNNGCDDHSSTTKTQTGEAHFSGCWTGKGSAGKDYQISFVQLPKGYVFQKLRIVNGSFVSGTSSADSLQEQFIIRKNQEVRLEIVAAKVPQNASTDKVQAIITQNGEKYTALNNTKEGRQQAAVLNEQIANGWSPAEIAARGVEGVTGGARATANLPSKPSNFTVTQDQNNGNLVLAWGASTNKSGQPIVYDIAYTTVDGTCDDAPDTVFASDSEDIVSSPLVFKDLASEDYGKSFKFCITARTIMQGDEFAEDPVSGFVEAIFQTQSLSPNVALTHASQQEGDNTITSDDGSGAITVPDDASDVPLACGVNTEDNNVATDLLSNLTDGRSTTQSSIVTPMCRTQDGSQAVNMQEPVDIALATDGSDGEEAFDDTLYEEEFDPELGDYDIYGFDGEDWELLDMDGSEWLEEDEYSDEEGLADETSETDQAGTNSANSDTDSASPAKPNLQYDKITATKNADGTVVYHVKTNTLFPLALVHKKAKGLSPAVPIATIGMMIVFGFGVRQLIERRYVRDFYAERNNALLPNVTVASADALPTVSAPVPAEPVSAVQNYHPDQTVLPSQFRGSEHPQDVATMVIPEQQQPYIVQPSAPQPTQEQPSAAPKGDQHV